MTCTVVTGDSPGCQWGEHSAQALRIVVHAVARQCHGDNQTSGDPCLQPVWKEKLFLARTFHFPDLLLGAEFLFHQAKDLIFSWPSLPSVTRVHFLPFCRCRCSRQYHRAPALRVRPCHLKKYKKKKNTKNIQKISFLGQSFLQVLMNIFLNPYKFYVFNIS